MKMNKKTKKILIIVCAVIVLGGIIGFSVNARRQDQTAVETDKVAVKEKLVAEVTATGEIRPKEYVELQSEIAGVITELFVKEGDMVQKGDLLLRIDPTQTETEARAQKSLLEISKVDALNQTSQISVQETNVQRDRANVRLQEAEFDRAQKVFEISKSTFLRKQELYEQNLISKDLYEAAKNELVGAETAVATGEARLEQAKAQLAVSAVALDQSRNSLQNAKHRIQQSEALFARTQDLLEKTVIRSPLSGVITKLNVEKGERAVPGTLNNPAATLMEIADLSVIEAEVEVDETDIVNVKIGQTAEVKVDALPDNPLKGKVTEVGNSAITRLGQQQEAKDFKVVIQLEEPPSSLRPGLSCTADITTATRQNVLVLPIQALAIREFEIDAQGKMIKPKVEDAKKGAKAQEAEKKDGGKKRDKKEFQGVFVVKDGKALFTEVKTGVTGETDVEVLSGLTSGTEIVTGSFKTLRTLKDGEVVKSEKEKKG
jgi:HlyD family secretion protein